ncbi:hypothetical protein [Bacillus anthracis]|nr:hypothetical protein [Bacillus anthracis]
MNGILSAAKLMKGHEIVERCAVAKKHPEILEAMESEAKQKLRELNSSK